VLDKFPDRDTKQWLLLLLDGYSTLATSTKTEQELMKDYIINATKLDFYGAHRVQLEQKRDPHKLWMWISNENIKITAAQNHDVVETFKWNEVTSWSYSQQKFVLNIGSLLKQTTRVFYATDETADLQAIMKSCQAVSGTVPTSPQTPKK